MKHFHYMASANDNRGNYLVLWHTGNYEYQIEDRSSGQKTSLVDSTYEEANAIFQEKINAID